MKAWPLVAANTHLYPGARLRLAANANAAAQPAWRAGEALLLEFSDGVVVPAALRRALADEIDIGVQAYRTASGTRIPPKNWRLRWLPPDDAAELAALKVVSRVP